MGEGPRPLFKHIMGTHTQTGMGMYVGRHTKTPVEEMYLRIISLNTKTSIGPQKDKRKKEQKHDLKPNFPNIRVKVIISTILKYIKYSYKIHKKN